MLKQSSILNVFNDLAAKAEANAQIAEGDYYGEDGLLYCHKCNTKKQTRVTLFGTERTVHCICRCRAEEVEAESRAEALRKTVKENRKASMMTSEMEKWTFAADDRMNERVSGVMQNYVDNFQKMIDLKKGLLLWGSTGTGKSFHAGCIANALLDKGYPVKMTNFSEITNRMQDKSGDKQGFIDRLVHPALLIIDDLGIERETEYMQEQVYNIINSRYNTGLPFIITTNIRLDVIKSANDIWKRRIYERILERCVPVEVAGANRRYKNINSNYDEVTSLLGL